jgi:hypothetical protein
MCQDVAEIFMAVAIPNAARVLDPVVPGPAKYMLSEVIEIVMVAPKPAIKVMVVPIGKATAELAGIVIVLVAVARMCLPASAATNV